MLPGIDIFAERYGPIRYFFAPMAGISDTVFRLLMRQMGAQIVVSELLSAEGLIRGGKRTREMMQFDERERPVGIQIFGSEISSLVEAAKIVQGEGADFVDINFGCPVRKVVSDGGGAAWLRDPERLGSLLTQVKSALRIPLSIKIRTGWDENSKNTKEVVHVASESGVQWVAIHGRTRAQGYQGSSDWDLIRETTLHSKIPIVGNGDLITGEMASQKLNEEYCHAVMIGRGALKNPWIFQEALKTEVGERDFLGLISHHFGLAIEKKDRHRAFLSLKKFMGWYAAGFPNSSQFRARLFGTDDIDALHQMTVDYFREVEHFKKTEANEPFLMGGHG